MKKRIISLMLTVSMLFAFASCSLPFKTGISAIDKLFGNEETEVSQITKESDSHGNEGPISLENIPEFDDEAYVPINDNTPFFVESEYSLEPFETYSELDSLGRCGVCFANVCVELMPEKGEERESISTVKPTGWINKKYDTSIVSGGYLYNRCHLIGWQLTAENANKKNLITGTRYLNIDGMLLFENMVADFVKENNYHVLYRVTPIFEGDNLLASGVLMEGRSVEDDGEGILFCVYCYNVQPGIEIDYATGESHLAA